MYIYISTCMDIYIITYWYTYIHIQLWYVSAALDQPRPGRCADVLRSFAMARAHELSTSVTGVGYPIRPVDRRSGGALLLGWVKFMLPGDWVSPKEYSGVEQRYAMIYHDIPGFHRFRPGETPNWDSCELWTVRRSKKPLAMQCRSECKEYTCDSSRSRHFVSVWDNILYM